MVTVVTKRKGTLAVDLKERYPGPRRDLPGDCVRLLSVARDTGTAGGLGQARL